MSQTADQPNAEQAGSPDDGVPPYRYTPELAHRIELAWQDRWEAEGTFHTPNPVGRLSEGFERVADRPKYFAMDMFPYPSGAGLHVGHPLGYLGTDVTSRFRRMDGDNVLHSMGYDAFGLPAEQYAVQTGQHPRVTTEANIAAIKAQLRRLGVDHDERRSFATIDPGYYKWTQWIFLRLFGSWFDDRAGKARPIEELVAELDAGTREPAPDTNPLGRPWAELDEVGRRLVVDAHRLAYLHQAPVNWCPGLGTVLSNEEVTADGRSERGNFPVFRRPLTQWMMRITAYADRLIDDLDRLDWTDSLKQMQRNWIGRSAGARIRFAVGAVGGTAVATETVEVFTTRPDTLFGATYMVLAPEHPLVAALTADAWPDGTDPRWTGDAATPRAAVTEYQRQASRRSELDRQTEGRDKTGVWLGATAVNPVNGRELPVFIADYVLTGYGTGAIMAVPGEDVRDFEFAEKFGLPVVRTVQPPEGFEGGAYTGAGPMINSANDEISLNGLDKATAIATITEWLVEHGHGEATTTYKLRDWLFSRQRYWGERSPSRSRCCRCCCRRSTTTRRRPSPTTTRTPRRSRRCPARPSGRRWSSTWATVPRSTAARPTRCPTGPGPAGTTCGTWTPATTRRWSTRRWSSTGWARASPATSAAWTCTSAASSTPSCTCCTPASGTRSCSTWGMSPARSRSVGW
jgi:leucyl-tRNA synthetase